MTASSQSKDESARWERITELFDFIAALPVAERDQALARLPPADAPLVPEIRNLLANAEGLERFLKEPVALKAVEAIRRQQSPAELKTGEVIEDFEVMRILGRGGAGVVYLCRQRSLDRLVALKVAPLRRALLQEARAMAVLTHENIVQVYGEWEDTSRGLRFLAMQYVAGVGLDVLETELRQLPVALRTGRAVLELVDRKVGERIALDPAGYANREILSRVDGLEAVVLLGIQLANALAYAHDRGVLHLDMKASNVLLTTSGRPLIADFGVALRTGRNESTEHLGGTIGYMPPEQLAVFELNAAEASAGIAALDGRSDVFALGRLLSELVEGLDVPEELASILRNATRERRDERPRAAELAALLESFHAWRYATGALPVQGFVLARASSFPLVALTLAGALPQLVASIVGYAYNALRVVSHLSDAQQALFQRANAFYIPAVYVVAAVAWLALVARLGPYLRHPALYERRPEDIRRLRSFLLHLPWMGAALTLASWLPGAVIVPAVMHWVAGPVASPVIFHLAMAFLLSCSLALGYCFLLHHAVVLRVLYPRFWIGEKNYARQSEAELGGLERPLRAATRLVAAMPLVGAFLILWQGAERTSPDAWWPVQCLVSGLLVLATFGITAGSSMGQQLVESLRALRRR